MEAFLGELLPRHLGPELMWRTIDYGSKQQLLARLPVRLCGYANIPSQSRPLSLVLVDRDDDDCHVLKHQLEAACRSAGLASISQARGGAFEVVNRIVVEELEAWFFGDPDALEAGWPGASRVARKAAYRDPDAIKGGTHEALLRELKRFGHLRGLDRLPKIETARAMGRLLDPDRNISNSFEQFWRGLISLAALA